MKDFNRMTPLPLRVPRTRRNHMVQHLSSVKAGVCHPIAFIPMLREDALNGSIRVNVEMMETKEILMNGVYGRVTAYVVPWLALDRFQGSRDQFDRSYMGQPQYDGGPVIPFVETHLVEGWSAKAVYISAGLHGPANTQVNTMYVESYNQIWNFRAKNRSPEITPRGRLDTNLAPAFWHHSRFEHVVPDFDQAVIDGEVALNVVGTGQLPVKRGAGLTTLPVSGQPSVSGASSGPRNMALGTSGNVTFSGAALGATQTVTNMDGLSASLATVYAELQENGITVSLSNIEMARKTQAFAKLRERFEGYDDDFIIDMLMDGLTIPDQALKQPILLADRLVRFGQAKRYATDAGNLAESAVSGALSVDLRLRVPQLNTGGTVVILAEFFPEQLFERQADPMLMSTSNATWPEYLRDTLDPEKVDVVLNKEIDTSHATPNGVFGYAPLNWKWNSAGPRVGGKFYRPAANTLTDEERQRLWAVEDLNPTLSSSFFIVDEIHQKPFLDLTADPFELTAAGNCVLTGNTVFGGLLVEATNNYEEVADKAPTDRIVKA